MSLIAELRALASRNSHVADLTDADFLLWLEKHVERAEAVCRAAEGVLAELGVTEYGAASLNGDVEPPMSLLLDHLYDSWNEFSVARLGSEVEPEPLDVEPHVCEKCGCTDRRACAGGCYWLSARPWICSTCGPMIVVPSSAAIAAINEAIEQDVLRNGSAGGVA